MNAAGILAIERALHSAQDDLGRAKHQQRKGGYPHGATALNHIIKMYQKAVDELTEALAEAKNGHTETKRGT